MMKLIADAREREYELTFLVPASLTTAEAKKTLDGVVALIEKHKGKVISQTDWGKKDLAYIIKKRGTRYHEANYHHIVFSLKAAKLSDVNRDLVLSPDLIRSLVVTSDPHTLPFEKVEMPEEEPKRRRSSRTSVKDSEAVR